MNQRIPNECFCQSHCRCLAAIDLMKDPPPQAGNSWDGGSIETAEGMEVSHAVWKVKRAATDGQDAAATVAPPDAIAQARTWEEGN